MTVSSGSSTDVTWRRTIIGIGIAALLSTLTSLVVTVIQINSGRQQSEVDFTREQRAAAYEEFIGSYERFDSAARAYYFAAEPITDPSFNYYELQERSVLQESAVTLGESFNKVSFRGSDSVIAEASKLIDKMAYFMTVGTTYSGVDGKYYTNALPDQPIDLPYPDHFIYAAKIDLRGEASAGSPPVSSMMPPITTQPKPRTTPGPQQDPEMSVTTVAPTTS